eukprot:Rhum_TRINITY_DN4390_c0_g1::Rhum_TRINITY_DN4390_c0_g1_i1::g.14141::m.14141/K20301/TRAPPC2, TRS20; trafficking protein particle complex subunit 2
MSSAQLVSVAVVGRQNVPLYLATYGEMTEEEELGLQCALVSSIDAVEEEVRLVLNSLPVDVKAKIPDNKYLGFVLPSGEHKVFASTSNTMVKLLCVLRGEPNDEKHVKELLYRMHDLYSAQVCNPFYELEGRITSPKFAKELKAYVDDTQHKLDA